MENNLGPAILGVSCTVLIAVLGLFFRAGDIAARVTELERWRTTIRTDMREISDALDEMGRKFENLNTLILERTDRRNFTREDHQ